MFVGDNASEKITAIQLFRLLLELLFGERFNFILKRLYLNTRFYEDEILIKWFNFLKKSIYMDAYEKKTATYNGEIYCLQSLSQNMQLKG